MPSTRWAHFRAWRKSHTHRVIAPKEPKVLSPSWNQEHNTPSKNHNTARWPRQARAEGLKWIIHFQQGRWERVRLREEKERWNKSSEIKCYKGFECWDKAACSMAAEPHYIYHYTWLPELCYSRSGHQPPCFPLSLFILTTGKSFFCFFVCNTEKCTTAFDFLCFKSEM